MRMIRTITLLFLTLFYQIPEAISQIVNMQDTDITTCAALFYDSEGGGAYLNNDQRTITFHSASECALQVQFLFFDIAAGDTLWVYDACSDSSGLIGVFTLMDFPFTTVTTTGSCVTFRFHSDASDSSMGWLAQITCPNQPNAVITANGPIEFCGGDSVMLTAGGGISYQWNTFSTTPSITVSLPGIYMVTVSDAMGCIDTASVEIIVDPLPPVGFILPNDSMCDQDPPMPLTGGFPIGGVYSGFGVVNGSFDPFMSGVGLFTINYTYTDSNGCSRSIPQNIHVLICQSTGDMTTHDRAILYPNPANEEMNVEWYGSSPIEHIEIHDLKGVPVYSIGISPGQNKCSLPLEELNPGMYFMTLRGKQILHLKFKKY